MHSETPTGILSGAYRAVWRWHFYAGLLVLPILRLMALTGARNEPRVRFPSKGDPAIEDGMKSKLLSASVLVGLVLGLGACHSGDKPMAKASIETDGVKASVEISDAWCRPTPNGAQTGACYLTVKSSHENRMTGAATPLAANAMIHDMSTAGGVMTMSDMTAGLPLTAGASVELKPGGRHLMLTGLTAPLIEGTAVPLTLTFSATPAMTVQAPVRQPK